MWYFDDGVSVVLGRILVDHFNGMIDALVLQVRETDAFSQHQRNE